MTDFVDFDVEIQDTKESNGVHYNGAVAVAGVPASITPSSKIQLVFIKNPNKGPNQNTPNVVILVSIDGTTNYISISRGEYVYIPGIFTTLKIDSTVNGGKYESIIWT